jgi:hypothetical protein
MLVYLAVCLLMFAASEVPAVAGELVMRTFATGLSTPAQRSGNRSRKRSFLLLYD